MRTIPLFARMARQEFQERIKEANKKYAEGYSRRRNAEYRERMRAIR